MPRFTKKSKIALVAAVLVFGITGTAYAYWTQVGGGTGSAGTGTTVDVTVNQTTVVTDLYPGGAGQDLTGTFDNPNASSVSVGVVSASVTATSVPECLPAWFTITGTGLPTTQVLTPGTAQGNWSGLDVRMLNDALNQDSCKSASITITYEVAAA